MSDEHLLIPGYAGMKQADYVSRSELYQCVEELQKKVNQMSLAIQSASLRTDALIRGWAEGNILISPIGLPSTLNLSAYYQYVNRMQEAFIPYLVDILRQCRTIDSKCERAKIWNDVNPDMRIWLDDISILEMPQLATPEERAAMSLVPGSTAFWEAWKEYGGALCGTS